jgi:hypothetical protein
VDASLNASQKVAFGIIKEAATYFSEGCPPHVAFPSWRDEVRLRRLDYNLEESGVVLPLKLGELLPGLPDACIAASLRAVDFAGEDVRKWLLNPLLVVKPEADWPDEVQKTIGMAKVIEESQIFTVRGQKVMSSFFAIQKKGVPGEGQTRVTRLIFNMVPVNEFLVLQTEDLSSLTPSTSWVVITLPDGRVLIWSGDDQKGAFFVWSLPEAWLPFMTICQPVPGHRVGRPDLKLAYLSLCVIPMGWILAVTLF